MKKLFTPKFTTYDGKPTLLVATGGTIGSMLGGADGTKGYIRSLNETQGNEINDPSVSKIDQDDFLLAALYNQVYSDRKRQFTVQTPFTKFSENLNIELMEGLINYALQCLSQDEFVGMIITHGSDTKMFTSAILSRLAKQGVLNVPFEVVHSMYPIPPESKDLPAWDGFKNFSSAVNSIDNTSPMPIKNAYKEYIKLHDNSMILSASPGLSFKNFRVDEKIKNLIIQGYHSCTAPVGALKDLIDIWNGNIYIVSPEEFSAPYDSITELLDYTEKKPDVDIHFTTDTPINVWAAATLGRNKDITNSVSSNRLGTLKSFQFNFKNKIR